MIPLKLDPARVDLSEVLGGGDHSLEGRGCTVELKAGLYLVSHPKWEVVELSRGRLSVVVDGDKRPHAFLTPHPGAGTVGLLCVVVNAFMYKVELVSAPDETSDRLHVEVTYPNGDCFRTASYLSEEQGPVRNIAAQKAYIAAWREICGLPFR